MSDGLHFSVLGRPRIEIDGRPLTNLVSAKAQALLAYLALTGVPSTRTALAGLLWGELPEELARANLRQTLTKLRKAVGDHITITWETVAFNPTLPYHVDVLDFIQFVEDADRHLHRRADTCSFCAEHLQQAATLYQRPLLHDFVLDNCAEFELWVMTEREQLHQHVLAALAQLVAYSIRQADYVKAQRYARRWLDLDPWNEAAHRQMMVVLVLAGQRTAALAQYQFCLRQLEAEFDVEPEGATQALYERIKQGHLSARASPARRNLPTPTTTCIGRAEDLTAIRQHIETPRGRLLTLVGPGGVGKTRLAIEVADTLARHFDDGVAFVALAPLRDAALVPGAIAQTIGVELHSRQPPDSQLKQTLRAQELLLVLDNLEHLLEAAPLLAELLSHCPHLIILATSREPLRLRGEQVYPVPPLAAPPPDAQNSTERMTQSAAVQLFVQRVRARTPDFAPDLATICAIAALCRRLDGLPLAIELAVGQIEWHSSADPLQRLGRASSSLPLLSGGARDLPLRHQTMRATIAWSVDLLDRAAQQMFEQLAVFVGGFIPAAVAAVCVAATDLTNPVPITSIQPVLASLVQKHLLQQTDMGDEQRYTLLETVREYALERLDAHGKTYACSQRHAAYFLALVEQAEPQLNDADQLRWLNQLEVEHNNIQIALGWALEADENDIAQRLAGALWRFWDTRGYHNEGRYWLDRVLARAVSAAAIRAKTLNALGMLAYSQSDLMVAQSALKESFDLRYSLGDMPGVAIALNNRGMVAWSQGDYGLAQHLYEQCLIVDRATGDLAGSAYTLGNLGLVLHHQGYGQQARARFVESLDLFRTFGNRRQEAFALHNLGMAAYHQQDLGTARTFYESSLTIKEELGDKGGIASTCVYLAQVVRLQHDIAATRNLLLRSVTLRRELSDTVALVETLEGCAAFAVGCKMIESATVLFGATHALREQHGIFHHAVDRAEHERHVAIARRTQPAQNFADAWARGQAMTFEEAQAHALHVLERYS